ncbi:MAG: transcriptional repressor [Candidatus Cloacimonadota bacterium]|nr:MAG: transcriptional repressor [Candidatus Cloacimonadota bacterium]
MKSTDNQIQRAFTLFESYLKKQSLKLTKQRQEILTQFLNSKKHISAEDLHLSFKKTNSKIGFSTVYRTLKLLNDCGLAREHQFGDRYTRYENSFETNHHDHLICTECGKIIEFESIEIENLQEKIAEENNFKIIDHKLELYGICNDHNSI